MVLISDDEGASDTWRKLLWDGLFTRGTTCGCEIVSFGLSLDAQTRSRVGGDEIVCKEKAPGGVVVLCGGLEDECRVVLEVRCSRLGVQFGHAMRGTDKTDHLFVFAFAMDGAHL